MCKKPCKECPYQKGSAPGYFGGNDPFTYRNAINRESVMPCHMRSKHDDNGEVEKSVPCTGLIFSMIKSCRLPFSPDLLALIDKARVIDDAQYYKHNALSSWEFSDYHDLPSVDLKGV